PTIHPCSLMIDPLPTSSSSLPPSHHTTIFPYTTLFRSFDLPPDFSTTPNLVESVFRAGDGSEKAFYRRTDSRLSEAGGGRCAGEDRKSTRLNSSHAKISYAVFCLKKKRATQQKPTHQLR